MFAEFFKKEVVSAFKQPMIYIFLFVVTLLCFGATASDKVMIGGAIGNIHSNSPTVVINFTLILSIFGILFATAFFNNAALRDFNSGFNEIMFSAPINKRDYFFGRFLGALLLSTVPLLGVALGILLGSIIGPIFDWTDPEKFGPTPWLAFLWSYFVIILPNMLISGAIIFGLSTQFRSTTISFVGAVIIFVGYIIGTTYSSDLENEQLAALIDIFGLSAINLETKYYTPVEKNTLIPAITSIISLNRIIWVGISFSIIGLFYKLFSFEVRKKIKKEKVAVVEKKIDFIKPKLNHQFTSKTDWVQFISFLKINFKNIMKSNTFKILLICSLIMILADLLEGYEYYGLQSYPVTYKILDSIGNNSGLFITIIIIFYSGELIWQSRETNINEVIDSTPHSSFLSLLANIIAIVGSICILYFINCFIGILYQLGNGFTNIKLDVYFIDFILLKLPEMITLTLVCTFIHVLINHKYIGYGASVLLLIGSNIIFSIMDIQSNMLKIASAPYIMYSDMNGFGPNVDAVIWFNMYWVFFGILLLLLGSLMWTRGTSNSFKYRLKNISNNLDTSYIGALGLVGLIWIGLAGNIYYNTKVLNSYKSSDENYEQQAEYEKKYKKYEGVAQPVLTDIHHNISIYPKEGNVYTVNNLTLKNKSKEAIDSLFFVVDEKWKVEFLISNAEESFFDEEIGFKKFALKKPLMPGDTLKMTIKSNFIQEGFQNGSASTKVVENGTFINNFDILPVFGYSNYFEISDKYKRREYNLPPRDRTPKLTEDNNHDLCFKNYLSRGNADWVNITTTISTSEDQIAIAPGSLTRKWKQNGRNYYNYEVDHISQAFASFVSARFEIAKKEWNGIDLEVYYIKEHEVNVPKMLSAMERSLKYYTENFGPYYHNQARIIEFPRYATFAQAFPGTMPYSEAFGFITNLEDEEENNIIDAVIAHEMAHQWWAHQEISADMQGSTMLTESFAEYSALMVMKQNNDDVKMKNFLKYNMNRYLRGRSVEQEKEMPLYKVENQGYIHYGKGSLIMYALQDYIGEDSVNATLKEFLTEFRYKEPPYPTSLDYLNLLENKVPDSLNYLVNDWFKEITLYDYRLTNAEMFEEDSIFTYVIDIEAKKFHSDSLGNEKEATLDDWVDVGLYADAEEKDLIYVERIKLDKNQTQIQIKSDKKAVKASVDPKRILIERIYDDNTAKINSKS
ncbi:hypothetical protein KMW28_14630 [Flammeovirga yaeyamensis]|uniref:Peptidase M1 membrane alanine aminopeptidase domain-containing protein n=1 Tax=Flammeovirga yaeyamensis TaxID=367791 RepID=A0AAX1N0N4_9BACT|nr:M1 family aminopeptidase [Flammeovirga yaeyamensis]MBB3700172.1 ABC-type transport system involved in multi-copper enzyme maturation permease subunit [Flammeovirga yaeyamensis]NMF37198.1 hypothetical protein [Flammeovirga yaeyamensis]QWG00887.1 hypothetical protein KMW28_14630 [Flammeovirga yaeyamensis]